MSETVLEALTEAKKIAGSGAALARMLDVSPQAVTNWTARREVPAKQAKRIEELTGVGRERLAPAVFS